MRHIFSLALVLIPALLGLIVSPLRSADKKSPQSPLAHDARLRVDLFAAAPDIVHPIAVTFDKRGRLLVIESHTHFRPKNYDGPKHDRIRVLEDSDGDGKADRFSTFFEGTTASMDLAAHVDGAVYLATRNEILRLCDSDGDGKADEKHRLIFLDTKGNYPHNGLSGLCFDAKGDLYFGMGENLGAAYKLIGADGITLTGGGEGGGVFHCTADGRNLRRVATGFWNPFGLCRDAFGRLFAVDNDPDAMPPCRLVHVVEGGDYGFQFRYGRSGRHPFQSWDGQLPGTLPMMSGTGEAPCEVLSYEADALPREYVGDLLVTSWADHRVERYRIQERGASYSAQRMPFVQGGENFRPVGMTVAPDGSLFVSDWVRSDYNLHGKGAIWHIRPRQPAKSERPRDRRRAAAIDADNCKLDLADIAENDAATPIRALAVRTSVQRGADASHFSDRKYPPSLILEAIPSLKGKSAEPRLLRLLADDDPFLRSAAVRQLSRQPELLAAIEMRSLKKARQRIGILLAWRASGREKGIRRLDELLNDADEDVRFLAVKWIADRKLLAFRPRLAEMLKGRALNVRLFLACSSALARLDGREVGEKQMADYFLARLRDAKTPPTLRVMALRMIPASHPKLTLDFLGDLLSHGDAALSLEAARALSEHPKTGRERLLFDAVRNPRFDDALRAQAILGLSGQSAKYVEELLRLAQGDNVVLQGASLRALKDTTLDAAQRTRLEKIARRHADNGALVNRVIGRTFVKDRPRLEDVDSWLKRLEGPADAEAGRRVFFHPKLAGCFRCHRVDGRGAQVGPDLSTIGRSERRHILESILRPSNIVAPHYQTWQIETADGKVRTGLLVRTYLDEYTYVNAKGEPFKVKTRSIVDNRTVPLSIMPDGLTDLLTNGELRDLLAYLCSRR